MVAFCTLILLNLQEPQISPSERRAIDRLEALGASVRVEEEKPTGYEIWIDFQDKATDEALELAASLKQLTTLRPMGGGFTDRGLRAFANHPRLWLLVVRSDKLNDASLEPISRISGLKKLDIMGAKLTTVGLNRLVRLKKLERLFLYGSQITDRDMEPLKKLTWLAQLMVPDTTSAATLAALRKALPKADISSI